MAYPKAGPTYKKVNRKYGNRPARTPAMPKSIAGVSTHFYDPDLNAFFEHLWKQQFVQSQKPDPTKPLAGQKLGPEWDQYLFPTWSGTADLSDDDGSSWYGSAFNWTIDKLSRPLYAVAEGSKDFSEQFTDVIRGGSLSNQIRDVGDMFRAGIAGGWQGFSGHEKTTFSEILRNPQSNPLSAGWGIGLKHAVGFTPPGTTDEWWRKHNKTTAAVGLTGDILLDPSTYVGLGIVGKLGSGARIFKDAGKVDLAVKGLNKEVDNLLARNIISDIQAKNMKRLLTAEKFRQGFQKRAGAQAYTGEAITLLRNIAADKGAIVSKQVFDDTLENLQKLNTITKTTPGGITKTYPGALRTRKGKFMNLGDIAAEAAGRAGSKVEEMTTQAMLDNYRVIVNADYQKALGLGTRNYKVPILPTVATENLAKIGQLKPLAAAANFSQKYLRNSFKIVEDVYHVKVKTIHYGQSTAHIAGSKIRDTFGDMSRGNRKAAWLMGLQRESTGGEMMVRAPGAKVDDDAAELFSRHVDKLSQRLSGLTGEMPYSAKEVDRMLPPGLSGIFKEKSKKEIAIENGLWDFKRDKITRRKGAKDQVDKLFEEQDWFRDSLLEAATSEKIKYMKDGGHALWLATAAVEHAAARRQLMDNLIAAFGFSNKLGKADPIAQGLLSDLKSKGWRQVNGIPELKDNIFNEEVATSIEKMIGAMDSQRKWGEVVKFFNRLTSMFKFMVTMPNPGYHIRNLMGDAFINWIDGAVNPADYRAAARLLGWKFSGMKRYEQFDETVDPLLRMEGDPLQNALRVENRNLTTNSANLTDAFGKVKKYITDTELYVGMNKYGVRQNFAYSQFGELDREINTFGTAFSNVTYPVSSTLRGIGEWREDWMRMAHFIHLVKTNPSKAKTLDEAMEWAGNRIRMTHFDYTDFTKFEQQYMSVIFPFYKWTRKALPLMSRFMFEHPGKVIIPEKITTNLSGAFGYWPGEDDPLPRLDNAFVPDWLLGGGYKPGYDTPGTGNPMFLRMPSPFSDILGFQGNNFLGTAETPFSPQGLFDTLMQQSNPMIRIPYELLEDKQTMFAGEDVPIDDTKLYLLNQVPIPGIRQTTSALGVGKEGEGNLGPLASTLTGLYSRELTDRDQRNELLRRLFEEDLDTWQNRRIRQILRARFNTDV